MTMTTRAGGAGAFTRLDLSRVPTPAFVVDEVAVERNLAILADIKARSGAKILLALKAFSMWALGDLAGRYLDGVCASGLWEARLGSEYFHGEIATYSPAYKAEDLREICRLSDHILFNSPSQHRRFAGLLTEARAAGHRFDVGLRINPEHSVGEVTKYDPSAPCSRLGFPVSQLRQTDLEGVDGLHFHALCEQDFAPLAEVWASLEPRISPWFRHLRWLNFGGGHHITRADYQRDDLVSLIRRVRAANDLDIYLEPGEAVALDAGILVGEVLDVLDNGMPLAILDISATCHMPDVIEAPYRPALMGEPETGLSVRLGGPSCLAGDVIGDYAFSARPTPGERVAFLDQAHYSMVKTNSFNGVPLPAIALWNSETDSLRLLKTFRYEDFRDRLS